MLLPYLNMYSNRKVRTSIRFVFTNFEMIGVFPLRLPVFHAEPTESLLCNPHDIKQVITCFVVQRFY
jgi:hypothetical protein